LCRIVREEVDRALHPESVDVLLLDAQGQQFESSSGRTRPLDADSSLVARLSHTDSLRVDLARDEALATRLTDDDRVWLADADARLVLPMKDRNRVIGLVVLGGKRSELPYSAEDVLTLRSGVTTATIALTEIAGVRAGRGAMESTTATGPSNVRSSPIATSSKERSTS
jgi:hypothetical protein